MRKIFALMILLLITCFVACKNENQSTTNNKISNKQDKFSKDKIKVERAVLDYVEALYNIDSTLVYRGVSRGLAKIGVGNTSKETDSLAAGRLTFQGLVNLANNWNKDKEVDPSSAIKKVIIYEVLNYTASVKLVASWGIDFMHLAKYGDEWKIVNVIYQGHPEED